jgi:hypothetical protein
MAYRLSRIGLKVKRGETTAPARLMDLLTDSVMNRQSFEELVRQQSEIPGAKVDGGDLGWIPEKELNADLRRAVQFLPNGRVTPPLRAGDFWCLFQVTGRLEDDPRGANAAFQAAREKILDRLRKTSRIEILDPDLQELKSHLPPTQPLRSAPGKQERPSR